MSSCTFVIINKGKAKYVAAHYSCIKELLQGKDNPENFREMSMWVIDGMISECTDTKWNPAVIIDFDTKTLTNTPFNWFDNFKQYLTKEWIYIEFPKQ